MRILAIDHHFQQDIDALYHAKNNDVFLRPIKHTYFSSRARDLLPPEIFSGPLSEYQREIYRKHRQIWAIEARQALFEIHHVFPFDAIIAPSDVFFYIRDVVEASHELGAAFIVVQKETTIAPFAMESFAEEIGTYFPFISDRMTVCSERHKDFWREAGAPEHRIVVTGQPRFDFYAQPERWRKFDPTGSGISRSEPPTVLFMSYMLDAYIPSEYGTTGASWARLRAETEDALVGLALSGECNLLIKPHPQQEPRDILETRNRLKQMSGNLWSKRVHLLGRSEDTRQLIVAADVVVGFQTTALFEALAAERAVIYAAWGDAYKKLRPGLIPFHKYSPPIAIARSPIELLEEVNKAKRANPTIDDAQKSIYEPHIGKVDGRAAQRVWEVIDQVTCGYTTSSRRMSRQRDEQSDRRKYCLREAIIATLWAVFWGMVMLGTSPMSRSKVFRGYWKRIRARFERQRLRLIECVGGINEAWDRDDELIGKPREKMTFIRRWGRRSCQ